MTHDPEAPVGPCRLCSAPSWGADDRGPVHLCCARAEAAGERTCAACAASVALNRKRPRR